MVAPPGKVFAYSKSVPVVLLILTLFAFVSVPELTMFGAPTTPPVDPQDELPTAAIAY